MATVETTYQCANDKCKAIDHDRSQVGTIPPPAVLNCYKCKAGRGMDPSEMVSRHVGMFPVSMKEEDIN